MCDANHPRTGPRYYLLEMQCVASHANLAFEVSEHAALHELPGWERESLQSGVVVAALERHEDEGQFASDMELGHPVERTLEVVTRGTSHVELKSYKPAEIHSGHGKVRSHIRTWFVK